LHSLPVSTIYSVMTQAPAEFLDCFLFPTRLRKALFGLGWRIG
jgi:hypothetical protein